MSPKRTLHLVVVGFVLFNLVLLYLVLQPQKLPPQTLLLPNGSCLELVGVTVGTNHLGGSKLAQTIRQQPRMVRSWANRIFGSYAEVPYHLQTPTPKLVLWFKPVAFGSGPAMSSPGILKAYFVDERNLAAGQSSWITYTPEPQAYFPLMFDAYPRRLKVLELQVMLERTRGRTQEFGRIKFFNPGPRQYPQWHPDPLPATRRAGDVEVTLQSFASGYKTRDEIKIPGRGSKDLYFQPDGRSNHNYAVFCARVRSLTDTNVTWRITSVSLADATGNALPASTSSAIDSGELLYYAFEPCLWPDEAAWKLKLELKGHRAADQPVQTGLSHSAASTMVEFLVRPGAVAMHGSGSPLNP